MVFRGESRQKSTDSNDRTARLFALWCAWFCHGFHACGAGGHVRFWILGPHVFMEHLVSIDGEAKQNFRFPLMVQKISCHFGIARKTFWFPWIQEQLASQVTFWLIVNVQCFNSFPYYIHKRDMFSKKKKIHKRDSIYIFTIPYIVCKLLCTSLSLQASSYTGFFRLPFSKRSGGQIWVSLFFPMEKRVLLLWVLWTSKHTSVFQTFPKQAEFAFWLITVPYWTLSLRASWHFQPERESQMGCLEGCWRFVQTCSKCAISHWPNSQLTIMYPCNCCLNREIQGWSNDRLHHQGEAAAGGGRSIHFLGYENTIIQSCIYSQAIWRQ